MVRGSVSLGILLTALTFVLATEDPKISIIKRESVLAANAVRAITIKTPQCKVQIASMATDFAVGLQYALYTLNNVIPNTNAEDGHDRLVSMAKQISADINHIQQRIPGDSELLKLTLASVLESISKEVSTCLEECRTTSQFVSTQLSREADFIIFVMYHMKYQARFFDKPSSYLQSELDASVVRLSETVKRTSAADKAAEDVYRDSLQHIAIIIARCVYKAENWIEVNPDKTGDIKILEDFTRKMAELYVEDDRVASGNHTADYMKTQLASIFENGVKTGRRLAEIDYPENTGGQPFIRSCYFEGIAVGNAYSENIENILGKA